MHRADSPIIKTTLKGLQSSSSDEWVTVNDLTETTSDPDILPPSPQPACPRRRTTVKRQVSPPTSPILSKRRCTGKDKELPSPELARRADCFQRRNLDIEEQLNIQTGNRRKTSCVKLNFEDLDNNPEVRLKADGKGSKQKLPIYSVSKENCLPAASTFLKSGEHSIDDWQISAVSRRSLTSSSSDSLFEQDILNRPLRANSEGIAGEAPQSSTPKVEEKTTEKVKFPSFKKSVRPPRVYRSAYALKEMKNKGSNEDHQPSEERHSRLSRSKKAAYRRGPKEMFIVARPKKESMGSEKTARKGSQTAAGGRLDDSDIVVIDTEEDDTQELKKKRKVREPESAMQLCKYPEENSPSVVTVTTDDYKSLEEGEFINDVVIDFYLTFLHREVLPRDDRENVYVFNTLFYPRLTKKCPKDVDSLLTKEQRQHKGVERWTKNLDLFSKDLIIFPICEESHWFLVVVVKPGLIQKPENPEDRVTKGRPFVILLDSLGGSKEKAVSAIRKYLSCEWAAKRNGEESFSAKDMPLLKPRKPLQNNYTDCGIYLLHYVEKMFQSIAQFFWFNLPDLTDWFEQEEVDKKRFELATHIKNLAKVQNGEDVKLPNIRLNDGTNSRRSNRRRKGRDADYEDVFIPDEPVSSPESRSRTKRSQRKIASRAAEKDDCFGLFGNEEEQKQAVAAYKIPKRSKQATLTDKDNTTSSGSKTKDVDPRVDNPAAIEPRTFYSKSSNSGFQSSSPEFQSSSGFQNPPKKSASQDRGTRENQRRRKVHGRDTDENLITDSETEEDRKQFKSFLQHKDEDRRKKADKENFKKFLDRSLKESTSSVCAKPESSEALKRPDLNKTKASAMDVSDQDSEVIVNVGDSADQEMGEEPNSEDLNEAIIDTSSPELIESEGHVCDANREDFVSSSPELIENEDVCDIVEPRVTPSVSSSPELIEKDDVFEPRVTPSVSSSPELIENRDVASERSRVPSVSIRSGSDSPQSCSSSGSIEEVPQKSRVGRVLLPRRRCNLGVPKIYIDADFDDSEADIDVIKDEPSRSNKRSKPRAKNLTDAKIEAKINRLTPGSSLPRLFSHRSSKSSRSSASSYETSGEFFKPRGVKISAVSSTTKYTGPGKRFVLGTSEPKNYRFPENPSETKWNRLFGDGESPTGGLFSDSD